MTVNTKRGLIATVAVIAVASATPPSTAYSSVNPALNGVYIATSDGQWSKTNEKYLDQPTVTSTWTITSSCTGAYDCTGTMTSDSGWTAKTSYLSGVWFVTRSLGEWQRCDDDSPVPGKQNIKFWENPDIKGNYVGWDTVAGPSGACGVNRPLFVETPFTLVPK